MTSEQFIPSLDSDPGPWQHSASDPGLGWVAQRLAVSGERSRLVQEALDTLRIALAIDRVVLYSLANPRGARSWRGQVTAESLVDPSLSILGTTGVDNCFGDSHGRPYLQGQVHAIADTAIAELHPCHRSFLQNLHVRASMVAPILLQQRLWGLLVVHHCKAPYLWSAVDIATLSQMAHELSQVNTLQRHR